MVGQPAAVPPGCRPSSRSSSTRATWADAHYIYGNRLNLGQLRADENALWSLGGARNVSVVLHLAGEEPFEVSARGESYMREGRRGRRVRVHALSPSGLSAHLHLSWLDPHKERRFTVVGAHRMATFDDMALEGKVTVYDKGFDPNAESYSGYIPRFRRHLVAPDLQGSSRCAWSARTFVSSILEGPRAAVRAARAACAVVRVFSSACRQELRRLTARPGVGARWSAHRQGTRRRRTGTSCSRRGSTRRGVGYPGAGARAQFARLYDAEARPSSRGCLDDPRHLHRGLPRALLDIGAAGSGNLDRVLGAARGRRHHRPSI